MKMIVKKILPLMLLVFVISSSTFAINAQTVAAVKVTKLHNPKVVVHKKVRYYRSNGVWYVKKKRRYVKVTAPAGISIATLPKGYRAVKVRGVQYYKFGGIYYKKSGRRFVVVRA